MSNFNLDELCTTAINLQRAVDYSISLYSLREVESFEELSFHDRIALENHCDNLDLKHILNIAIKKYDNIPVINGLIEIVKEHYKV